MNAGNIVQIGGAIKHTPLHPVAVSAQNVTGEENGEKANAFKSSLAKSVIGGFIGDGQLVWRAAGSTIEIFDLVTDSPLAAWSFGANLKVPARITCVCGIGTNGTTHVAVGVHLKTDSGDQGLVGILSLRRSRIIRAFHFKHKITCLCMVTGGDKAVDSSTLAPELRFCAGLMAVATARAFLYLVDLKLDLDDKITSDETSSASLVNISFTEPRTDLKRRESVNKDDHSMICLSNVNNDGYMFRLLGLDDVVIFEAPSSAIYVTSMVFFPQLASLLVGYNFGSFQIHNLNLMTIDYASPFEDHLSPVVNFACQEPENDPRSFVYLWVCHSPLTWEAEEEDEDSGCLQKANCALYAMNFDKKEWIEGHGLWYQGLCSMSSRFDLELVGDMGSRNEFVAPSRILAAMTVFGTTPSASSPLSSWADDALSTSSEESDPVPEMSLCLFFWESAVLERGVILPQYYVSVFDINQWYQSQMPSQLRLEEGKLCPYMAFHMLDKVPKSMNECLLSGSPKKGTWSRHRSRSHCEKTWYPSSLSYEFNLLSSDGLVAYRCASVQQNAISVLAQDGPGAIVSPVDAYNLCAFSGILPAYTESSAENSMSSMSEREQLLNTALEFHLLSLLVQCVTEFSEGRFNHIGCSLQMMLDWAWKQLTAIKQSSDNICASLFAIDVDSSPQMLIQQDLTKLHQNLTYLSHLSVVISTIRSNAGEVTDISASELEGRVQVVNLLHLHLQATLWFYHCGLLPQYSSEECADEKSVPYPVETLQDLYKKKREEIRNGKSQSNGFDLLLIDSIVEECGPLLPDIWGVDKESGRSKYPPPTLHALLSVYLLPSLPTHTKHRMVQYLFLDLASLLSENYAPVLEELVKFPSSFSLSPSLIKLTQAFWLIDNKEFQAGLSVLLDPLVNPGDITLSQHRLILKAFLLQGEASLALAFNQIRSPPMFEQEDLSLQLNILLGNGRMREAFHFQRKYRMASDDDYLLDQFFCGCQELGRLENVVHLPLSPFEEEAFIAYLKKSKDPLTNDILLVYFLQQSRYGEISSLQNSFLRGKNVKNRGHNTRVALFQSYVTHLPDIQSKGGDKRKSRPLKALYNKPQPLSAHIRQSNSSLSSPRSKSTILRPGLQPHVPDFKTGLNPYTPFRTKTQRRVAVDNWRKDVGLPKSPDFEDEEDSCDTSKIVFPTHSSDLPVSLMGSPLVHSASFTLETPVRTGVLSQKSGMNTQLEEDISKAMEEFLKSSKSFMQETEQKKFETPDEKENLSKTKLSREVLSLLKTPPVQRRSLNLTADRSGLGLGSTGNTPQSILKVRKMLQQSHGSDLLLEVTPPVFPALRSATKSTRSKALESASLQMESSASITPKHLRFNLSSEHPGHDESDEAERSSIDGQESGSAQKRKRRSPSPPSPLCKPTLRKSLTRSTEESISTSAKSGDVVSSTKKLSSPVRKASPDKSILHSSVTSVSPASSPTHVVSSKADFNLPSALDPPSVTISSSSPSEIFKSSSKLLASPIPKRLSTSPKVQRSVSPLSHHSLEFRLSPCPASVSPTTGRSPSPSGSHQSLKLRLTPSPSSRSSISPSIRRSPSPSVSLKSSSPSPSLKRKRDHESLNIESVAKSLTEPSEDDSTAAQDDSFHSAEGDPCDTSLKRTPIKLSPRKVSIYPSLSPEKFISQSSPQTSPRSIPSALIDVDKAVSSSPKDPTPVSLPLEHEKVLSLSERVDECLENISIMVEEAKKNDLRSQSLSPKSKSILSGKEQQFASTPSTESATTKPLTRTDSPVQDSLHLTLHEEKDLLFKQKSDLSIEEFAQQADIALDSPYVPILEFSTDESLDERDHPTQSQSVTESNISSTHEKLGQDVLTTEEQIDLIESRHSVKELLKQSVNPESSSPKSGVKDTSTQKAYVSIATPRRRGTRSSTVSPNKKKSPEKSPVIPSESAPHKPSSPVPSEKAEKNVDSQDLTRTMTPLRRSSRTISTPIREVLTPSRKRKMSGEVASMQVDTPHRTPLRHDETEVATSTPAVESTPQRRRRSSGVAAKTTEVDAVSGTPLRRSSRRISVSTPVKDALTPHKLKLNESSTSVEKTPKTRRSKLNESIKETPVKQEVEVERPSIQRTPVSKGTTSTETLKSGRKDTPRTRSTRKSLETVPFECIEEETQEAVQVEVEKVDTPRSSSKSKRRKSIVPAVIPMEPLLETITEESELSNNVTKGTSSSPKQKIIPVNEQLRRSRRRSGSLNPSPQTASLSPISEKGVQSQEAPNVEAVASRTRRSSFSSNQSENSPERAQHQISNTEKKETDQVSSSPVGPEKKPSPVVKRSPRKPRSRLRAMLETTEVNETFLRKKKSSSISRRAITSMRLPSQSKETGVNFERKFGRRRKTVGDLAATKNAQDSSKAPKESSSQSDNDDQVFLPPTTTHSSPSKSVRGRKSKVTSEIGSESVMDRPRRSTRTSSSSSNAPEPKPTQETDRVESEISAGQSAARSDPLPSTEEESPTKRVPAKKAAVSRRTRSSRIKSDEETKFTFQEPSQVVPADQAISEEFQKMAEEIEQKVSDVFAFSPPFQLNKRTRRVNK